LKQKTNTILFFPYADIQCRLMITDCQPLIASSTKVVRNVPLNGLRLHRSTVSGVIPRPI